MSRLYLPKIEPAPATILAHLIAHFPQIPPGTWRERVARGVVTTSDGAILSEGSPYCHGITICYDREVPSEPDSIEQEEIVYQDGEILVADKPHGMPVTPAGEYLERSLLVRLQKSTGVKALAPMHRLDRNTAGIVLFAVNPASRGIYHQLFAEGNIDREYLAVAHIDDRAWLRETKQWRVENRMEAGDPWYTQRIVDGPVNAVTEIELLGVQGGLGLFRLRPQTGRKHQLRVHMMSIGFPIAGDPVYPRISEISDTPLQLLATRLAFIDPLSGKPRTFTSARKLLKASRDFHIQS